MNRHEAYAILSATLDAYRAKDPDVLRSEVGPSRSTRVTGPSGAEYLVEAAVYVDERDGRRGRVEVSVDAASVYLDRVEGRVTLDLG